MPAVGLNPYFLLLFSRYVDLEIRFQSKKKKQKYKEIQNLTKEGIVLFFTWNISQNQKEDRAVLYSALKNSPPLYPGEGGFCIKIRRMLQQVSIQALY